MQRILLAYANSSVELAQLELFVGGSRLSNGRMLLIKSSIDVPKHMLNYWIVQALIAHLAISCRFYYINDNCPQAVPVVPQVELRLLLFPLIALFVNMYIP